jgi:O-antigen biosynthesis protein
MTSIAVCAIFKDEASALSEWVAYHRCIGVDHFFLYDNESSDDGTSTLLSGSLRDYVTITPIASGPAQQRAYKSFMNVHAHNWDWVAFIDLDEFIHPIDAASIKELLPRYQAFSGVLLHWLMFGPNGHELRPDGLVIDNYLTRLPTGDEINRHVKSLVRTAHLIGEPGVHVFSTTGPMCNSCSEPIPTQPIQDKTCHDTLCINHYYTKSREDWDAKMRRGRADVLEGRGDPQYAVFDNYAKRSVVTDARITRFSRTVTEIIHTRAANASISS